MMMMIKEDDVEARPRSGLVPSGYNVLKRGYIVDRRCSTTMFVHTCRTNIEREIGEVEGEEEGKFPRYRFP